MNKNCHTFKPSCLKRSLITKLVLNTKCMISKTLKFLIILHFKKKNEKMNNFEYERKNTGF